MATANGERTAQLLQTGGLLAGAECLLGWIPVIPMSSGAWGPSLCRGCCSRPPVVVSGAYRCQRNVSILNAGRRYCFVSNEHLDLTIHFPVLDCTPSRSASRTDMGLFDTAKLVKPRVSRLIVLWCDVRDANGVCFRKFSQINRSPKFYYNLTLGRYLPLVFALPPSVRRCISACGG